MLFAPSARIVQQAFGSRAVHFFYDQIFVKEELTPGSHAVASRLHLLANRGHRRLLVAVDVRGPRYPRIVGPRIRRGLASVAKPVQSGVGAKGAGDHLEDGQLEDVPQRRCEPQASTGILSWDLEPGDAILFHALVLHGSRGNNSAVRKRRALTTRWCGDDVVYQPIGRQMPILWKHGLESGDPLSGRIFPQVFPALLDAEVGARMHGPIAADPGPPSQLRKSCFATLPPPMSDKVLMVGSVPLDATAEDVFTTFGGPLGPFLDAIPDGEIDDRRYWTMRLCFRVFNGHPANRNDSLPDPQRRTESKS